MRDDDAAGHFHPFVDIAGAQALASGGATNEDETHWTGIGGRLAERRELVERADRRVGNRPVRPSGKGPCFAEEPSEGVVVEKEACHPWSVRPRDRSRLL
jgi:hypothetical protein